MIMMIGILGLSFVIFWATLVLDSVFNTDVNIEESLEHIKIEI
jgi:hypothetical protein